MLHDLVVEGLGVIERAELQLPAGATVITGETGAGKTLVVSALGLLLGGRADRAAIRSSSDKARVEGRFVLPSSHDSVSRLAEYGLIDEALEGQIEVVVSREVTRDGGKARVNGRLVTLTVLSQIVEGLVEIAGQNEHQRLTSGRFQRELLDRFAGDEAVTLGGEVSSLYREGTEAIAKAEELRSSERERARQVDALRFEISEIRGAEVAVGEWDRLVVDAQRLESASDIASGVNSGIESIRGEGGAEDQLTRSEREIRALVELDPQLAPLADRLERARIEIADVAGELSTRSVEADPALLSDIRARLDVLNKIKRKYGDSEADVLEHLSNAEQRLAELEGEDSQADAWLERGNAILEEAVARANRLSELRREAAERLKLAVEERLILLAMPGARFHVAIEPRDLFAGGLESISFEVSANSGEAPRPIARAVSGGELSRIALALHVVSASTDATLMVFDEVDAGVGGKAALEVGRALAALAEATGSQVLVVTHLPQVAAFANAHLRVVKSDDGQETSARVEIIDTEERVDELSRMLAGMPESEGGRRHAEELLELASKR